MTVTWTGAKAVVEVATWPEEVTDLRGGHDGPSSLVWRRVLFPETENAHFVLRRCRPDKTTENILTLSVELRPTGPALAMFRRMSLVATRREVRAIRWLLEVVGVADRCETVSDLERNARLLLDDCLAAEPAEPAEVLVSSEELELFSLLGEPSPLAWQRNAFLGWLADRPVRRVVENIIPGVKPLG